MQVEQSVNPQKRALRLAALAGSVYIGFGLLELTAYFYQEPVDYIQLFLYTVIGVGLIGKHAWSRVLGILVSAITLLMALIAFIFYREIFWSHLPAGWGRWYAVAQMVIQAGILYILFHNDVRKLFFKKEN